MEKPILTSCPQKVMKRFLPLLAGLCLLPALAFGQTTDTLEKVRQSKQLLIGVRTNALPFSTLSQGTASGYSVDLCHKVLESVRKELKLPDLKPRYVPVSAADRMSKLKSGEIDIECGSTVNTKSRQNEVAFSYSTFFAGERLLVRTDSRIQDLEALPGKTVAVLKGSTAEKMFSQIRDSKYRTMKLLLVDSTLDAFNALETGKANAVAQLDILEESVRQLSRTPDAYVQTQQALSVEPMALMVRRGDKAFLQLVDRTLGDLYASGDISPIYDRWFNSGTFHIPMSQMLRDAVRHPNREPAVALGLGYEL